MSSGTSHEPRSRARRRALQALYQWQINPCPAFELLRQFRAAQDFSRVDEDWFEALVRGVIGAAEALDARLAPFLDRPAAQLDPIERAILRMGAWELIEHPEVHGRIVINEAVDMAHRFGAEQGHGYVNAVLDRAAREWRPEQFEPGTPGSPEGDV